MALLEVVSSVRMKLGLDGIEWLRPQSMIPTKPWSDAKQQVTPAAFERMINAIDFKNQWKVWSLRTSAGFEKSGKITWTIKYCPRYPLQERFANDRQIGFP